MSMKLIRMQQLKEMTGLSMSTILRMERMGKFPRRRKISTQAMGWLSSEVETWMKELPQTPKGVNPAKKGESNG